MPNPFFTTSLPPSQEWGFFSRLRWLVLGGGGKFSPNELNRYYPGSKQPIIIDSFSGDLMEVAMEVPHLNTVISTGAELFSLMEIKHLNKDKEEIEDSPVLKFLRQPNPLQSQEQYAYEFYVLNAVYNKTFQHQVKGLSIDKLPAAMWLLPPGWMKINPTGKIYRQTDINEIIESYEMVSGNISDKFEVDRVIYMAEGIGGNILNPISRIDSLKIPLSNIIAALKSENVITSERGMIGFISPAQPKDSDGLLPLMEPVHEKVRKEYQKTYSLDSGSGHIAFPSIPMQWTPMTFDVKQLQLLEIVEDSFAAICASFRHDRDIYPSIKGATYENKSAGMKSTIQNGLQPLADKLMRQLSKRFLDEKSGESLVACYDHLPAMKEDERLAAQGKLYTIQGGEILLNNGVIDHDGFAQMADVEMSGDKKIIQRSSFQQPKPER